LFFATLHWFFTVFGQNTFMTRFKQSLFFALLLILANQDLCSQATERPKIGLCLSGGGARGLAHIALLKAIDSLDLRIDYITGTSMGAIVGGLYAIGYSAHQLDSIARTTDWQRLFEVKIPLSEYPANEQDEFGRYIIELPVREQRIALPSGFIEGQALLRYLESLTAHVAHIKDFDQLPIPFRCMAANLSDGQPILLDRGNLAFALRTTMSIPGVFAPILMDKNKIVVDGGVFKNFPVDVLCDMGADQVIGGYTSVSLLPETKLFSLDKIMAQSVNYGRVSDPDQQRLSCTIMADYADMLNEIGLAASDFNRVNSILAVGDSIVKGIWPELAELAKQQRALGAATQPRFEAIPSKTKGRPLPPMQIYGNTQAPILFKAGLHHDSQMRSGIIGNFTLRNIVGKHSRTLLAVEISENYKFRAEQRNTLRNSRTDAVVRFYSERVLGEVQLETNADVYSRYLFRFQTGLQRPIGKHSLMGFFLNFEQVGYRPDILLSSRASGLPQNGDTLVGSISMGVQLPAAEYVYLRQTYDQPIFPKTGGRISVQARFGAGRPRRRYEYVSNGRKVGEADFREWMQPYLKVLLRWEQIFPLFSHIKIHPKFIAGARLTNVGQEAQLGVLDRFNVGSGDWRNDWSFVPFLGNRDSYTMHAAFVGGELAFPIHFKKKYFVVPQFQILFGTGRQPTTGTPILFIGQTAQQGYSISAGMHTAIGPVWISAAKADNDRSARLYTSIGLRF
jgi:predicted acylesterase/phospholipase RssA